jgi:hypothetical protein
LCIDKRPFKFFSKNLDLPIPSRSEMGAGCGRGNLVSRKEMCAVELMDGKLMDVVKNFAAPMEVRECVPLGSAGGRAARCFICLNFSRAWIATATTEEGPASFDRENQQNDTS